MKTIKFLTLLSIATVFILSGCSLFQRFSQEVNNISKLQFKLDQVNNFTLNSVKLSNISKVSDISAMDIMSLTKAISNKYLPVNFTLNVIASNPNKVTSRTSTSNDANNTSNFDAIIENISCKDHLQKFDMRLADTNCGDISFHSLFDELSCKNL